MTYISLFSLASVLTLLLTAPAASQPMNMGPMAPMPQIYGGEADKPGAPLFTGLGDHHHPISTTNAQTQRLFDQGVNLLFGFNHAEAIRSFREAARLDPSCAMCWWGVAFALGPNINMPMQADAIAPAWQALQRARALEPKVTRSERSWVEALAMRYSAAPPSDRHPLDEAFAQAMGQLWRADTTDLDAGVFYAEAMMDTQPWDYWQAGGEAPKGHAGEIISTLQSVITQDPNHPGALHLYIHAQEASAHPERAEAAADRLVSLMPQAGHIVHMPSHIYYRVGRFADAIRVNELAAKVDEAYIVSCRAQGFYPVGYYGHNIHFLWTSSEMAGRYQASIDAARRLLKATDAVNVAAGLPQAELYAFTPVATFLRFGKWREVLAEPPPPDRLKLDQAVWLYAQGFAHANTGDLAAARTDRAMLARVAGGDFSKYQAAGLPASQMASLSLTLLDGEIDRKSGDLSAAIAKFQVASKLETSLPYTEPPYWHEPVSHILGAALLEAGRPAEAQEVYEQSLQSYRGDGWALAGLSRSLREQGKLEQAKAAQQQFETAWSLADMKLDGSRF